MCGRFTLTTDDTAIVGSYGVTAYELLKIIPLYNIAPTQDVPVIAEIGDARTLTLMRWGLIPSWAKDETIGNKLINARAETIAEKPSFRAAFKRRRCLVPADGFYEWKKVPGHKAKQPVRITLKSGAPFAFAGLWEMWLAPGGSEIMSFTIITTSPNDLIGEFHHRMPVIIRPEDTDTWMDHSSESTDNVQGLLAPFPSGEMKVYPVSTAVNSPANDSPQLVLPLE